MHFKTFSITLVYGHDILRMCRDTNIIRITVVRHGCISRGERLSRSAAAGTIELRMTKAKTENVSGFCGFAYLLYTQGTCGICDEHPSSPTHSFGKNLRAFVQRRALIVLR